MDAIEIQHLSKRYGDKLAVDDLSFTVEPGKVTGFLGPNGAGKSTTMRMIIGLDRPDKGSARIGGRHYRDIPSPMRRVGALLEAKALHPGRSAREHLRQLAASQQVPAQRLLQWQRRIGHADGSANKGRGKDTSMGTFMDFAALLTCCRPCSA